ncbi:putative oxidoreductase GLYR1 homolog [Trichonephila clavipes]|nr:putative oxidoreductase GLYR1 homolog [Trichonephila clavipes]
MESQTNFENGDLVWAKMKNYPFWPAKIVSPPTGKEMPKKKSGKKHYVFFFGTEDYAFIAYENIVPHSDEMLNKVSRIFIRYWRLWTKTCKISNRGGSFDVSVWSQTPEICQESVDAGAHQFSSPADLFLHCNIIFCLLSGPEAVKSIVLGNEGILQAVEESKIRGKGYVELSAMDRDTILKTAAAITEKGGKYLAAPLSGPGVDSMSQLLKCSGDFELFETCHLHFYYICSRFYFLGPDLKGFCNELYH